jgi:hypothetical protein
MKPKSFGVCIYEVKELAWGETFDDSYSKKVTMSDGSVREIHLTPIVRDGEELIEYDIDGFKQCMRNTSTNINGDVENGKGLMVQVFEMPSGAAGAMVNAK